MPEQWRHLDDLATLAQPGPLGRLGIEVGIQHDHVATHVHFVGNPTRHPDRPLWRYHPIAQVGEHFQRAGGGVGELPARVGMSLEHGAGRVLTQGDQRFGGIIVKGRNHGPILSKDDLT